MLKACNYLAIWRMREAKAGRRWEAGLDDERSRRSIRKARCRSCGGAGTISILSDQLTAYQLAEPDVEQTALCVLVKTKEPKIAWHLAKRSGEDLAEFLAKADIVGHDIADRRFYKRSGKWCSWCDYLGLREGREEDRRDVGANSSHQTKSVTSDAMRACPKYRRAAPHGFFLCPRKLPPDIIIHVLFGSIGLI